MGIRRTWRRSRTSSKIGVAVTAVGALLLGFVIYTAGRGDDSPAPDQAVVQASTGSLRAMTFLGDSYTEGTGADSPQQGWAYLSAKQLGYIPSLVAQGGAGYVSSNPTGLDTRNLAQRVSDVPAYYPNVVVVAAGLNDANRGYSPTQIQNAVGSSLGNLREAAPTAMIIVLGPFWPSGNPTPSVLQVRDIVKSRAESNKMPFIDPIAEQWITGSTDGSIPGNRAQFIGPDGTHPTPAGHVYIAQRFEADVKARNLIPVGAAAQ